MPGKGVQFKPIKGDPLDPDPDLGEIRPYFPVKAVLIHGQIARRMLESDEAGQGVDCQIFRRIVKHGRSLAYSIRFVSSRQDRKKLRII